MWDQPWGPEQRLISLASSHQLCLWRLINLNLTSGCCCFLMVLKLFLFLPVNWACYLDFSAQSGSFWSNSRWLLFQDTHIRVVFHLSFTYMSTHHFKTWCETWKLVFGKSASFIIALLFLTGVKIRIQCASAAPSKESKRDMWRIPPPINSKVTGYLLFTTINCTQQWHSVQI